MAVPENMNTCFGAVVLLGCYTQQMCISAHKLPLPNIMLQLSQNSQIQFFLC